jgi:hypothetical protein
VLSEATSRTPAPVGGSVATGVGDVLGAGRVGLGDADADAAEEGVAGAVSDGGGAEGVEEGVAEEEGAGDWADAPTCVATSTAAAAS